MTTTCIILAAGQGKRMRSQIPKVLHEVCGEPMIWYPVSLALARQWSPVVVISKQGGKVREFLEGRFGQKVRFGVQDPPLGTGHALMSVREQFLGAGGKAIILYGDVPLLSGDHLDALLDGAQGTSVAFLSCRVAEPTGYGRVVRDERGEVERIVEHRDATPEQRAITEVNTGIYLMDVAFLGEALDNLQSANDQGEYYLTDVVELAFRRGLVVKAIEIEDIQAILGVNDRRELARSEALMNRRLLDALMLSGVTVVDPARTSMGPRVQIGPDTVVYPDCSFQGEVRVGAGCRIGPGAVLGDCSLADGVRVQAYSVLEGCTVAARAVVGPFARLRPGAALAEEVKVGNFVEIKKSRLGKGSKANHLAYIGDAEIGAGVNIGAGTITCNYDGIHKHKTIIEDGVFIGSDTQLVAPVKVGKDAVVGAGTTVTVDVPAGALAVSRVRQQHIEGYAEHRQKALSAKIDAEKKS